MQRSPAKATRTGRGGARSGADALLAADAVVVPTAALVPAVDPGASSALSEREQPRSPTATAAKSLQRMGVVVACAMPGHNTRAVHAGRELDAATGAIVPPIHLSTTFARGGDGELLGEYLYGRHENPNRNQLERCLAELEGGAGAMAFSSGCAVAHAIASSLGAHDRLLIGHDLYFGIRRLARTLAARGHFELRELDLRDLEAVRAHATGRRGALVVLCESPSNPLMQLSDIGALAETVERLEGALVVDNTMATPVLQNPLALGAHYVMHSSTKYIGGHSDVLGGALVCRDPSAELWQRALEVREHGGGVPSPFDCWLLLRSIATLPLRVERQCDNAARLAALLESHPRVEEVLYPGLASHPEHALSQKQMRLPGAMMSVLLGGGEAGAAAFVAALRLFTAATSLGGVHSLAEHRARVEGPASAVPRNLVRLSVGIEDFADLAEDIAESLGSQ